MESLSPQVVSAAKLPIPNPNKFDLWKMRIEQYFLMTDYSLWEVILNGDSPTLTRVIEVTAADPKPLVTRPRQAKTIVTKPHSPPRRNINRSPSPKASNFPPKVIAAKTRMVNAVKRNWGNPQHALKDKGVIDSGCSRHMTGNISYLSDFKELNGGYVAFSGNPKGGKISGKGNIRTGKLDFDDVYFVKELKFNLFSVSQIYDKKNNVLFTDTKCLILSPKFKLPDENQVLLRVPRENNMYNVDLKNIVPSRDLTCLFANATLDESNLWHRRLGNINLKTMNKLVKDNLVRGLPSKFFDNDHTCVACKKGKQHRASYKTKPVSSVNQPLQRTLIEAAKTMLADSLLPIPFWAEAVNTACYFQNRVLVTKTQNKTPYELLLGRTPSIGFMRPFGCLVTILNTLAPLGKFNGKVDEGFLVGYYVSSKAFRVFNSKTQIIQETLHINFLENKLNVAGSGHTWLFDIDNLSKTMNYQPVTAGNQSNPSACVQENFDAEKAGEENGQQYVLFPVYSAQTKKHDDKTKREAKGKSPIESSTGYRNLSAEFEDFPDNNINEDRSYKLFLAYASFMGFMVYQMDVESALLYGTIKEDVYVCQPPGFKDSDYPEKVYKVVKALYGLHQDPRAWYGTLANYLLENGFKRGKMDHTLFIKRQKGDILLVQIYVDDIIFGSTNKDLCKAFGKFMKDKFQMSSMVELTFFLGLLVKQKQDGIFIRQDKYVVEILRKFGLTDGKSASTSIDTEKPLLKDLDGEDVDMHTYRSMTGSLMYLTLSRPDIMLAVYALAYLDSDYIGASLDRTSTTGGCQFLGCRLISWQWKKQTAVATSSTEVALSSVKSLKRMLHVTNILSAGYITTPQKVNDVTRLQALVDKKKVIIIEATIRDALRLDDAEGIDFLPNEEIFTELSRMGYEKPSTKLTFYKAFFLPQWKFLIHTILQCMSEKRTSWNDFSSSMALAVICLSTGMLVAQQVDESAAEVNVDDVLAAGVADEGAAGVNADAVLTAIDEPFIPSHTPHTQPPPPTQNLPCTSQDAEISMDLLHNLLDTCTTLTRRVKNLEQDKIAQALEITKLQYKVKKLERRNKGRIIASMDADVDVTLKHVAKIAKEVAVDAEIEESVDVQGRQAESQAQIYQINLEHADKVLSMHDDEVEPAELQEVVEVVTTAKLITEVVTAASATINAAAPTLTTATAPTLTIAPSAARKRKRVVIRDPEETATPSTIIHSEAKSKDKRKGILDKEDNVVMSYQALKRKPQTKAQDRKNMMIYLRNMAGFKMDYFKGMKYDDIHPIFEKYFNSNVAFLENTREQMEEEDSKALKRITIPELLSLLRNFDREDFEVLWELVKERFTSSKPKNFLDDFLLTTLIYMFEKPNVQAQVWKNQRTVNGLAKIKSWRLLESCGVHIITFTSTQMILLVKRRYLLTRFTLDQMLNNVILEVEEESEAKYALEILHKHGMEIGQSISTPMATKNKLDADLSGNPIDQTVYRSKIRSLMYLTSSRPNIVQAVCYCARYQSRPIEKHLKEVKRIFRYLRGTINMGLWYSKGSSFGLTAFSDADHAGCTDTRKSTSGGIKFLGDKLVSWMSKKQNYTAMSSAEAEYVALSASCAQVMWMRTQLQDYGLNYNKIPLYCDSQSAIAISCNAVQHSHTKHIHTRYHFIKERVENGIIKLYFVITEYQLADMFTKALPEDRFKYLVRRICMRCLTPVELEVLAKEST
nr:retrovirus-related Pol polyprotein from transposon TNT 1-94 [Tanacetum cinerariifolium]